MINWIIEKRLSRAEKKAGVPLDYLRWLKDASRKALFAFSGIFKLSTFHTYLSDEVYYAARITTSRLADCGTCLQIEINHALGAGLSETLVTSIASGKSDGLPQDVQLAVRFASTVVSGDVPDEDTVTSVESRFGREGRAELALAITSAQAFPTMKRATGFAQSCAVVRPTVQDTEVM